MLSLTWLVLLAMALAGYVFGAHGYGVQMLAPFLDHRLPRGRADTLSALEPVSLVHEAWVSCVAILVVTYPWLRPEILSGLTPLTAPLLGGVLVAHVAVRLRGRASTAPGRRAVTALAAMGAIVATAMPGAGAGLVLHGAPNGIDGGGFVLDLTDPFVLLCAMGCVALFAAHGATFLAWRRAGVVAARAQTAARRLIPAAMVVVLASTLVVVCGASSALMNQRIAVASLMMVGAALLSAWLALVAGRVRWAAVATTVATAVPVTLSSGLCRYMVAVSQAQPTYPPADAVDPDLLSLLILLVVVVGPLVLVWSGWILRSGSAQPGFPGRWDGLSRLLVRAHFWHGTRNL